MNITKWLPLIMTGMSVAQKMGGTGEQKLNAVMDSLPSIISSIETGAGDVINEPAVYEAIAQVIASVKTAEKVIAAAKAIRNKPVV